MEHMALMLAQERIGRLREEAAAYRLARQARGVARRRGGRGGGEGRENAVVSPSQEVNCGRASALPVSSGRLS